MAAWDTPGAAVLRDPARPRGPHGRRRVPHLRHPAAGGARRGSAGSRRDRARPRRLWRWPRRASSARAAAGWSSWPAAAARSGPSAATAEDDRLALRLAMILASILLGPVLDAARAGALRREDGAGEARVARPLRPRRRRCGAARSRPPRPRAGCSGRPSRTSSRATPRASPSPSAIASPTCTTGARRAHQPR